jgi:hypothetical protein
MFFKRFLTVWRTGSVPVAALVSSRRGMNVRTLSAIHIQDYTNRILGLARLAIIGIKLIIITRHFLSSFLLSNNVSLRLLYHNGLSGPQGRFSWEAVYSSKLFLLFLFGEQVPPSLLGLEATFLFSTGLFAFFYYLKASVQFPGARIRIWE